MLYQIMHRAFLPILSAVMLSGCALGGLTIPISDPLPSKAPYSGIAKSDKNALSFLDERTAADKASFSTWIVQMSFVNNGKPLDPFAFVAEHTTKELAARGIPVKQSSTGNVLPIKILKIGIENHRVSGFSPLVTLTGLVADVDTPSGTKRLTAFVKRAKVPVMSFDELNIPCYDEPMDLITKELAAKINRDVYGLQISDAEVDRLLIKINAEAANNPSAYFDVYQLGFGNNPKAISGLVKLTSSTQEYVRLAAISSLGILQAHSELPLLEKLYQGIDAGLWQDRAIALKAIGDLNTEGSKVFLQQEKNRLKDLKDKGSVWTLKIIDLYLKEGAVTEGSKASQPIQLPIANQPANNAPARTQSGGPVDPSRYAVPATTNPSATGIQQRSLENPGEQQLVGGELNSHFMTLGNVRGVSSSGSDVQLRTKPNGDLFVQGPVAAP
jgi:hypothetical protein